jgi:hypothetical protein
MAGLAVHDHMREVLHLGWDRQIGDVLAIGVADLVAVAQHGPEKPLVPGLDHQDPLTAGDHDPGKRHHAAVAHGIADHGEYLVR